MREADWDTRRSIRIDDRPLLRSCERSVVCRDRLKRFSAHQGATTHALPVPIADVPNAPRNRALHDTDRARATALSDAAFLIAGIPLLPRAV